MHKIDKHEFTSALQREWTTDSRWDGITRPYSADDVYRLRGSIDIEYSLARYGAARLWQLLEKEDYVAVLSGSPESPDCRRSPRGRRRSLPSRAAARAWRARSARGGTGCLAG